MMVLGSSGSARYGIHAAAGLAVLLCQFYACGMVLLIACGAVHEILISTTAGAVVTVAETAAILLAPVAFCCWQLVVGRRPFLQRIAIYISLAISAGGLWYGIFLPHYALAANSNKSVGSWGVVYVATGVITFFGFGLPLTVGLVTRYWLNWVAVAQEIVK